MIVLSYHHCHCLLEVIVMIIKKHQVKLKLTNPDLLKIQKEVDMLICLFFNLKYILIILIIKNSIKELINNLNDNKQITKQVYNNLIKAITYKNDS